MSDEFKLDLIATDAYTRAHGEKPFTHMKMIDRQLKYFNIPYDDFVASPRRSLENTTWSDYLRLVDDHGVRALSSSGACTVLAIRASTALEEKYPSKYDFKMYDVGFHRICRCSKTFVVIDSSNRNGAEIVPPGREYPSGTKTLVWNADGTVRKTTARGFVENLKSISFKEGLATCLWEIADSADLVTLFRFTSPSGKRYTGAKIQWVIREDNHKIPSAKYLNLMKKTTDKNPKRVVWKEGIRGYQDRTGTPSTNIEA